MKTDDLAVNEIPIVLFVPGGVMPGDLSYGSLLRVLGYQVHPIVKDLEVCRSHFDPPHRAEPERFGRALRDLWVRSDVVPAAEKV